MDADFALALRLQLEEDKKLQETRKANSSSPASGNEVILVGQKGPGQNVLGPRNCDKSNKLNSNSMSSRPLSIVDDEWELIDPVPNIIDLFLQFNDAYFDGLLAGVEVKWSARMTLCAGLCRYEGRGGLCSIRLSQPLLKLRPRRDLVQTLLHEMIHAVLFVTHNNKDHDAHGPEFLKHMHRINKQTGTNITVYHNFHDEVNNYRQHWWRCDGPCQKRPPFYGIVRRSMNRAPSKNDTWWAEHMRTCGGKYTKIKEPEDYGKKTGKRKLGQDAVGVSNGEKCVKLAGDEGKSVISFPGKGKTLGGGGNEKISKWFKPVNVDGHKESNKTIKESLIKGDSKTMHDGKKQIESESKFGKKEPTAANGHIVGGTVHSSVTDGRAAWIEQLVKKQQIAIERRKKFTNINAGNDQRSINQKANSKAKLKDRNRISNIEDHMNRRTVGRNDNAYQTSASAPIRNGTLNYNDNINRYRTDVSNNESESSYQDIPYSIPSSSSSCDPLHSSSSFVSSSSSSFTSSSSLTASSLPSSSSCFLLSSSSSLSSATAPSSSLPPPPPKNGFKIMSRSISDCPTSQDSTIGASRNKDKDPGGNAINNSNRSKQTTIILDDSSNSNNDVTEELVDCPVCPQKISVHLINIHLDECLSMGS
eukprot:gene20164-22139_t